jgi:hypothetical protein
VECTKEALTKAGASPEAAEAAASTTAGGGISAGWTAAIVAGAAGGAGLGIGIYEATKSSSSRVD